MVVRSPGRHDDSERGGIVLTVLAAVALLVTDTLRWLGAALLAAIVAGLAWEWRRNRL